MQNDGSDGNGTAAGHHPVDPSDLQKEGNVEDLPQEEGRGQGSLRDYAEKGAQTVLTIVISDGDSCNQVPVTPEPMGKFVKTGVTDKDEIAEGVTPKKGCLSRSESSHELCRVCLEEAEEALIELGCRCRGGLAKAHQSCIDTWFRTRGSNKCEICQQVAVNVPPPEPLPNTNYWIWRVDPTFRAASIVQERERGCFSPLWVALSILIGGLLLDVLISISLGVSALPVNIIIGVLVVLGLGTALRLALECCQEWSLRRVVQRVDTNVNLAYHPAV